MLNGPLFITALSVLRLTPGMAGISKYVYIE